MIQNLIDIKNMTAIPGLVFRHFHGESDYPKMVAAIEASAEADKLERVTTVEDIANSYSHLVNSDPYQDMIFAEVNGEVIGYSRGWWQDEDNGPRLYGYVGFLIPAWRRKGIGGAMLQWMESHLREVASRHPIEKEKFFESGTSQDEKSLAILLEKSGYIPVRHFWEMVRPNLDNIPDFPLPEGLEVRPVQADHYRAIWEASNLAFRDHWGFSQPTEEDYQQWLGNKTIFQPDLWQVAWDTATNQVAGQVRTFIDHAQNEKYKRKRGYTEFISVARPWRKRGVARALIVRSLRIQKEKGMTESALGVDSENLSGATRVYEDCGFEVTKQGTIYRKPL